MIWNPKAWNRQPIFMSAMIILPLASVITSTFAVGAPNASSGYNVLACDVKNVTLDEGHSFTTFGGNGTQISVPGSAYHMSHIECLGAIENMADKSFKANGYCLHVDRDGDKWIDHWWNDSTMKKGRWEVTGLSGKLKGARVTGTFIYTDLSSEGACKGVSYWEADR